MTAALKAMENGMTVSAAAAQFKIPKTTLHEAHHGIPKDIGKLGRKPFFFFFLITKNSLLHNIWQQFLTLAIHLTPLSYFVF